MTIRSKHSDLLNYFIYDDKDLSKEYLKKVKKVFFIKSIDNRKSMDILYKEVNNILNTRKGI